MSSKKKNTAGVVALYGVLVALAFIFGYIESLIPLPLPQGVKLGLANIVVMFALYILDEKSAAAIAVIRVILSGLTFSGISMMMYSLVGSALSLLVMILLKRVFKFGTYTVSVCGAIGHNLGQIIVAILVTGPAIAAYFPVLLLSGVISGIIIGFISAIVIRYLKKIVGNFIQK